jgi:hypothetical protein
MLIISFALGEACVSWGEPESEIAFRKIEIDRKPKFEGILILPLTGTVDSEGLASETVQNEAKHLLGKGSSLVSELNPIFEAANAKELMPLALQPQMLWFEDLLRKTPIKALISGSIYRFPGMEFGLRLEKDPTPIVKVLASHSRQLENLSKALEKNDKTLFQEILTPQKEIAASLSKLQYWAEVQFEPNWLMVFFLDGTNETWDAGKSVTLKVIALNFESGGIRFAGSSTLNKTVMAVQYKTMLTTLTNTLVRKVTDYSLADR